MTAVVLYRSRPVIIAALAALFVGVLRRYSTAASRLLLPYLLWVTFAAALNLAIVRLNAPFQTVM